MRTFILFLAIWGITNIVEAQDYFPLNRLHSNSFYFAGNHEAYGISIRSSTQVGSDSVFLMNHVLGDASDSCQTYIYKSNAPNSFIDSIYKSSAMEYSFRMSDNYIYINYNSNWNFNDKHAIRNTGYLNPYDPKFISLENISFEKVLGDMDTILSYSFYTNTKKLPQVMKVSKEHGLIVIPYFFTPWGGEIYSIQHSIPKYNDIYNYQIGDKYETRGGGGNWGRLTICECISRSIDSLKDSAYFGFFCKYQEYSQFGNGKFDSLYNSIYINNYSKPLFTCLPGEVSYDYQGFHRTYNISRNELDTSIINYSIPNYGVNGPISVTTKCKLIADSNDTSRYISTLDWTAPYPEYEIYTYASGLGVCGQSSHMGGSSYNSSLTYYKSANKTSGTMAISESKNRTRKLQIIPNPATQYITFDGIDYNEPCKLIIHDIVGKIIYQTSIPAASLYYNPIDISSFDSGIYITELLSKNNEHIAAGKFVKE